MIEKQWKYCTLLLGISWDRIEKRKGQKVLIFFRVSLHGLGHPDLLGRYHPCHIENENARNDEEKANQENIDIKVLQMN